MKTCLVLIIIWVDPRVRGGDFSACAMRIASGGRSPRARGRRIPRRGMKRLAGSIPACAGETKLRAARMRRPQVDPRVRGGDNTWWRWRMRGLGRSPRARGRPPAAAPRGAVPGSIPACAGETPEWREDQRRGRVDPRVRGGDADEKRKAKTSAGRSPRARGRQAGFFGDGRSGGSIPACAGETAGTSIGRGESRVDPRVRGGDASGKPIRRTVTGRSPRARGRRFPTSSQPQKKGSIPACAGETDKQASSQPSQQVDPRVRGGDSCISPIVPPGWGRSPRARGRRPDRPGCAARTRSIRVVVK